jgi:hypothetical protein
VTQWSDVLGDLDRHRQRAFAENDPAQLNLVYRAGPLLSQDRATLARVVPSGCRAPGLATTYTDVRIVQATVNGATLRTDASLAAGHVVCAGVVAAEVPARQTSGMQLTIVGQSDGSFRIAGLQLPGSEPEPLLHGQFWPSA